MKGLVKRMLFGSGNRDVKILFGAASGIEMHLSVNDRSQRILGLEEREIQKAFRQFANKADIFVDIGASDGYYGLLFRKLNNKGTIFLCDSVYRYADFQKQNFELNQFSLEGVHRVSKFVCDFSDDTHVDLDSLLSDYGGDVFFKIDVDGGELEVLKGVERILASRKCRLIIETHSQELETGCIAYLKNLGYSSVIIPNAWWRAVIPERRLVEQNRWLRAENDCGVLEPK